MGGWIPVTGCDERGLTVEKAVALDVLGVPAVAFRVTLHRSNATTATLVDEPPIDVQLSDLAFHADYGATGWRFTDDRRLRWTGRLSPGETVTTLFGVDVGEPWEITRFLDAPTVETLRTEGDAESGSLAWRTGDPASVSGRTFTQGQGPAGERLSPDRKAALERAVRDALAGPFRVGPGGVTTVTNPDDRTVADLVAAASPPAVTDVEVLVVRVAVTDDVSRYDLMSLYRDLEDSLDVLAASPDPVSLADGEYDGYFDVVAATNLDPEVLRTALTDVTVVAGVGVSNVSDVAGVAVEEPPQTGHERPSANERFQRLKADLASATHSEADAEPSLTDVVTASRSTVDEGLVEAIDEVLAEENVPD